MPAGSESGAMSGCSRRLPKAPGVQKAGGIGASAGLACRRFGAKPPGVQGWSGISPARDRAAAASHPQPPLPRRGAPDPLPLRPTRPTRTGCQRACSWSHPPGRSPSRPRQRAPRRPCCPQRLQPPRRLALRTTEQPGREVDNISVRSAAEAVEVVAVELQARHPVRVERTAPRWAAPYF